MDRGADLAAELAPLFAQLADTEAACDALVEKARSDAVARRGRDTESAHAIVATAARDAATERAAAVVATQRAGQVKLSSIRAIGEQEAEELRRRAAARMPDHVARVVAVVRTLADPPSGEGRGVS